MNTTIHAYHVPLILIPLGRISGLIIDTSSAFASAAPFGPSGDQKHPLVKLAVEAFDSE